MTFPSGDSFAWNVEAIGYCDLEGRPGFKLALHKHEDRWYLYTAKFWHPGFSIVEVTDPANPQTTGPEGREQSVLATAGWQPPSHLREPEGKRGRIEKLPWKSERLDSERDVQVYLPPGYGEEQRGEAGGFIGVPDGEVLKPGMTDARIPVLRERLIEEDIQIAGNHTGEVYDGDLVEAVKIFQDHHGLATDGVIGKNTLARLNIPIQDKLIQMELNMERRRWMRDDLGEFYVFVNLAAWGKIGQVVGQPAVAPVEARAQSFDESAACGFRGFFLFSKHS